MTTSEPDPPDSVLAEYPSYQMIKRHLDKLDSRARSVSPTEIIKCPQALCNHYIDWPPEPELEKDEGKGNTVGPEPREQARVELRDHMWKMHRKSYK